MRFLFPYKGRKKSSMELSENRERLEAIKTRARMLTKRMTLEEKVFQTMNAAPGIERLGIRPYDWWNEALHGVARAGTATVFPQAIALAASFDEELVEAVGDAVAEEGRAKYHMQQKYGDCDMYKGLTFWAPNVNIFRDPRWGRGHETYGEDPFLTSRLGVRYIQGLQGHDEKYLKAAGCAKHFAVHSGPEGLRHGFDAKVTQKDLYETYLPAFQACVEEGHVEAVMGAYNRTNGEPCCASRTLLCDILRDQWGFEGHVVSDCAAIRDIHENHKVTDTPEESAALAMNHGCDLNCGKMFAYLLQAVKSGKVSEERLNEAIERLLTARMKLGILEDEGDGHPYTVIPYTAVDSDRMKQLNLEAAKKCVVLLKNENHLLPLKLEEIKTIGVVGPNADNQKALVGNYEGTASRYWTVLEGIEDYVGDRARVLYSEGCPMISLTEKDKRREKRRFSEVKAVCEESDVIVACLGLDAWLEGEQGDTYNEYAGGDKPDLSLPQIQEELLELIGSCGKPVILILLAGSALAAVWADDHIPAILQGWYPGAQGGRAIAEILFGDANPEGKLPVTFYRSEKELPPFEDYSMEGRTYRFMSQEALYPFGYGLSYTDYTYGPCQLSQETLNGEGIFIQTTVKNTGAAAGNETVEIYVKANEAGSPNPQLKGFRKVHLEPGEEKTVTVNLPITAFYLFDEDGKPYVSLKGYTIFCGGSQPDARSRYLTGKEVLQYQIRSMK